MVKLKRMNEKAVMPSRASEGAVGYDLCSVEEVNLEPGMTYAVDTGWAMEIPLGFEAQIRPRSGLAIKNKVTVLNTPGTIDPDFRGVVKVILHNFGSSFFKIETGSRIAQMVINKVELPSLEIVEELSSTDRGNGGFGSTGLK